MSPRSCCAPRALPISAMSSASSGAGPMTRSPRATRISCAFRAAYDPGDRCRRADHGACRRACRLLRTVRPTRGIRSITDLKGKSVGVPAGVERSLFSPRWPPMSGSTRSRTSTGSPADRRQAGGAVRGGQDRRVSRLPARAAGTARPANRPCDRQQLGRPAVVAVFLLHAAGNREYVRKHPVATKRVLRAILKAADLCATEPARVARRLVDGGFHRSLRLCAADAERDPLRQMAGIRRRGYDPVLRAAACTKPA